MNQTTEKYIERCYLALYWTLERIFRQSKAPKSPHPFSLCNLLSDMCPFTFKTGLSADPGVYFEYKEILCKLISDGEGETPLNGYCAGRSFIQMYITEFEYELEDTLLAFSLEDYSCAYEKLSLENTP